MYMLGRQSLDLLQSGVKRIINESQPLLAYYIYVTWSVYCPVLPLEVYGTFNHHHTHRLSLPWSFRTGKVADALLGEELGMEDLEETIAYNREVLTLLPIGHPDGSNSLNNLANALAHYRQLGRKRRFTTMRRSPSFLLATQIVPTRLTTLQMLLVLAMRTEAECFTVVCDRLLQILHSNQLLMVTELVQQP